MVGWTVLEWLKGEGASVRKGDLLLRVEWDEGLVELESGLAGRLGKILVGKGQTVKVGAGICEIQTEPAAAQSAPAKKEESKVAQQSQSAAGRGKVIPILMPKAGQSVEEATLVKWRVGPGTRIKKGDVIFDVETDKATIEVEAVDEGRLAKIVLEEGGVTKVLESVGYLAENDQDVEEFLKSSISNTQHSISNTQVEEKKEEANIEHSTSTVEPRSEDGRVKASPAARKLAQERGVDLSAVKGTGPGGRIVTEDVLAAAGKPAAAAPAPAARPMPIAAGEIVRRKMSGMRKAIARNLLASKQNVPHFYMKLRVSADALYAYYQGEKAKYPCSLNDLVTLASAKTIAEFPAFRSKIDKDKDEFVEYPTANIGIAVGMDDGLVVPVLVGVDRMNLQQVAAETKRLVTNARGGKIEGMGQGVFTITNLGMFGVEEFYAIINPPESAILAVGTMREDVIVSGGALRIGRVMTLTLSADHRTVDGMLAGKFMGRLKELLENPVLLA